jgi:hypothetical protein
MAILPESNERTLGSELNLDACVKAVRAGEREAYRQIIEACEANLSRGK